MKQEELKALFEYSPETGMFRRRKITHANQKSGWFAGSLTSGGRYYTIRVDGRNEYVHRLAWLYMTGECPEIVDHINGDSLDNRLCNLRPANKSTNMMNSKLRSGNSTGHKGISWDASCSQYHAYINVNGVRFHKYYDTLQQAVDWRAGMAEKLHFDFQSSGRTQNSHAESGGSNPPTVLDRGFDLDCLKESLGNSTVGQRERWLVTN